MAHNHFGAERVVQSRPLRVTGDMNITPMIDVLLVLLVIFMAALPMSQRGLDTNLPAESQVVAESTARQIVIEYTAERALSINKQTVTLETLEAALREIFAERRDKTLFVMAAGVLRYGDVVRLIDAAKGAGVERVGIVTDRMRQAASP